MENITFECLWEKDEKKTREAVKAMWRRYHALDGEALIETRSREFVRAQGDRTIKLVKDLG